MSQSQAGSYRVRPSQQHLDAFVGRRVGLKTVGLGRGKARRLKQSYRV